MLPFLAVKKTFPPGVVKKGVALFLKKNPRFQVLEGENLDWKTFQEKLDFLSFALIGRGQKKLCVSQS